ncbi:MAG: hypothetical protein WCG10_02780 [Chlamydiota bacterium]
MKSIWLGLFFLKASFLLAVSNTFRWESTDFIWNFGLVQACDVGLPRSPKKYFNGFFTFNKEAYLNIKQGDTVWVPCRNIPQFYKEVLPFIENSFVLVIADGDESFPSDIAHLIDLDAFIADDRILHIFSQNCDYQGISDKVERIPIGLDFHSLAYKKHCDWDRKNTPKNQEEILLDILSTLQPTYLRIPKAFVDFQLNDTTRVGFNRYLQFGEDRSSIFNRLLKTGCIDYSTKMTRSNLWKKKGEYAFSISPHGNGLDCHRTWEDLILGCIVIVKTSPLDALYRDLPVVIVQDWDEITEDNLNKWIKCYGDAFTNPMYREKLNNNYWLKKFKR